VPCLRNAAAKKRSPRHNSPFSLVLQSGKLIGLLTSSVRGLPFTLTVEGGTHVLSLQPLSVWESL
jgi:hypothetical protein